MKSIRCTFGFHDWDACKCRRCDKIKPVDDPAHDWDACICRHCGARKPVSDGAHDWDGCKCRKCGLIDWNADRSKHDWNKCECRRCGKVEHTWIETTESDDVSERVGSANVDSRTFEEYTLTTTTSTCTVCGKTYSTSTKSNVQVVSY